MCRGVRAGTRCLLACTLLPCLVAFFYIIVMSPVWSHGSLSSSLSKHAVCNINCHMLRTGKLLTLWRLDSTGVMTKGPDQAFWRRSRRRRQKTKPRKPCRAPPAPFPLGRPLGILADRTNPNIESAGRPGAVATCLLVSLGAGWRARSVVARASQPTVSHAGHILRSSCISRRKDIEYSATFVDAACQGSGQGCGVPASDAALITLKWFMPGARAVVVRSGPESQHPRSSAAAGVARGGLCGSDSGQANRIVSSSSRRGDRKRGHDCNSTDDCALVRRL